MIEYLYQCNATYGRAAIIYIYPIRLHMTIIHNTTINNLSKS